MATAKELLQGIILEKFKDETRADRPDVIAQISESKIILSKEKKIKRYLTTDGNVMTSTDSTGSTDGTDIANTADRVYLEDEYDLPSNHKITLVINPDDGVARNIDIQSFKNNTLSSQQVLGVVGELKDDIMELLRKVYNRRYEQVRQLLINLPTGVAPNYQKPFGFTVVDDVINRPTYFKYTNLMTGVLSEATRDIMVDLIGVEQVNAKNDPIGLDQLQTILHASSIVLPEKYHLRSSHLSQEFVAGDSYTKNKSIGVYGDTVNRDNWIGLTPAARIYRRGWKRPNQTASGIQVTVDVTVMDGVHPVSGEKWSGQSLVISVYDGTIMVNDGINGIAMSVN